MATTTVAIPLTTLTSGSRVFGPFSLPASFTAYSLTIDRTAGTSSLNGGAGRTLALSLEVSFDGGVTWLPGGGCSWVSTAGAVIDPDVLNDQGLVSGLLFSFGQPITGSLQIRATLSVTGGAISLSGSLVAS